MIISQLHLTFSYPILIILTPPSLSLSQFFSEPAEGYGVSSVPGDGISRAFLNRVLSVWMPPSLSKPSSTAVSPETLGVGGDPRSPQSPDSAWFTDKARPSELRYGTTTYTKTHTQTFHVTQRHSNIPSIQHNSHHNTSCYITSYYITTHQIKSLYEQHKT